MHSTDILYGLLLLPISLGSLGCPIDVDWVSSVCAGAFERHQSNHMGGPKAWQMQSQPVDIQMGSIDGLPRQRAGPSFAHNSAPVGASRVSLGGGFQMMGQVSHYRPYALLSLKLLLHPNREGLGLPAGACINTERCAHG